ncbi:2-succinyl-5-enolpyruvyl-6-hydroxy-3-cyclohexene-1-carboxylic-acid synthase [Microbacterium betulae]|uniref:2-succinyl-5-enolpyruvyl-6-hydroxy-3-cyclohexene-1-carboxylate synthase n=1 Tax=Microbacterium betulae TaxID=2981139 RepID=A0AA97FHE6_9MICO|nr:2-succinyl-5-enolpyruvyl-6-hydroxy-3-cyclohexene-1-carboxylic-acid synthase [Microbacterium sp. AB]WOF23616.1 2-succinyl-5-enolpyruvyl-6-hydroxy-3-cyclohexene-1-carboxylic-acid synthase [Microbacterium sp. AB]
MSEGGPGERIDSPASASAWALLSGLVALGVRHVVVSPGSRSQALALAAARLEREGAIRLHVRIDERVAGFSALGIGRETREPAAVVCTSGTAVANLLPAALEAHHSGVPLLLLTADRPAELRGVGANQATGAQSDLFRGIARLAVDASTPTGAAGEDVAAHTLAAEAYARAVGGVDAEGRIVPAGPVHLNLPYREPLAGHLPERAEAPLRQSGAPAGVPAVTVVDRGPRTVVVAGADAGPMAEEIAHRGGWPLIAEIVSGARFGRQVVHGYREALREPELGGRIERAVVLGHPTLSREVTALLSDAAVDVVALRGPGEELDLNGRTIAADAIEVGPGAPDRGWLGAWTRFSRAHAAELDAPAPDTAGLSSTDPQERRAAVRAELDAVRRPLDREQLAAAVWAASWPHDRLVFGSSRLVRVADAVLAGKRVPVHGNRGLAGIDGTVATAMGIAVASQAGGGPGVTRVLLGDLALLHDVGALLLPDAEDEPRIQVVVGNDRGGTIFDGLEVAATASEDDLTRVQYTPQSVRIEHLATAYGWEYQRVTTRGALDQALTSTAGRRKIVEVPLAR